MFPFDINLPSQKDDCFEVEVGVEQLPENHRGLLIHLTVSDK
jgi:hypothetical protein